MPTQTTKPSDYPQAVLHQIKLLAQHIVIARKRRKETQAQWAQRLGVSQPTMARIERGDPSVSMASYVMCMWLINQAQGLADLIAPQNDMASLEREVARTRPRSTARATAQQQAQKQAKVSKRPATKTAATSTTHGTDFPFTSAVNAPPSPGASHRAGEERSVLRIDPTDAAQRATGMAAGLDHQQQAQSAMRIAGPSTPGRVTNSTAAGLAALISGQKKTRP